MTKKIIFVVLGFCFLIPSTRGVIAKAEEPAMGKAAKFFTDMPLSVLEFINRNRRLDMLDYYATDSIHKVPNGMEGVSFIERVSPTYIKVQITSQSNLQISALPTKKDTIYQCIYTISTQDNANDSEIRFYTKEYMKLNTDKYIKQPMIENFISSESIPKEDRKDIINKIHNLIPFTTITYEMNPENLTLTASLTSMNLCPPADYSTISRYIRPTLNYIWNGKKFELTYN